MTGDITQILYRIKENIAAIEAGDDYAPLLSEVRADFLEFMELAKLFLISERDSYYGYFLMNVQFSVSFGANCIAGIKLNTFPPVFESNPLLLCKFKLKEILYVICHEIDHIVFNHPAEMLKINPHHDEQVFYEFNLAADAAVNERINYERITEGREFLSAPEGLITANSLKEMYHLVYVAPLENYAYYFSLIAGKQQNNEPNAPGNGQDSMMRQQNEMDGAEDVQGEPGNEIVTAANCGRISDHNWEAGDDAEDAQVMVREFVNAAMDMMNEESRGMMPAHFTSQVAMINKPSVLSWQAILKKYIGTISAGKRTTRARLNRRQPERFDLSGRVDDKVLKIAVAIDTSASVDDHMIAQIFNEIFAILAKRKHEITVIECDAQVQRVYRAKNVGEIQKKVAGRGGTMFTPVIEYINNDKYFRDALLIYFTDGFGEREIPKPKTYRNLWVVFEDERHLSVKEPYGVVLKL